MDEKVKITLKGNNILPFKYNGQIWSGSWNYYNSEYVIVNEAWTINPKDSNAKNFSILTVAKPFPYEEDFEANHCKYEDAILSAFLIKISKLDNLMKAIG